MDIQPLHPLVVQLFAIAANVATCAGMIVAIAGVGVAIWASYKAYTVWKDQLTGTEQYELASRIFSLTYQLRGDLVYFREALKFKVTIPDELNLRGELPKYQPGPRPAITPEKEFELVAAKWRPILKRREELKLAAIEAKLLFDNDVNGSLEKVFDLLKDLDWNVRVYQRILTEMTNLPGDPHPEIVERMWMVYDWVFYEYPSNAYYLDEEKKEDDIIVSEFDRINKELVDGLRKYFPHRN